MPEKVKIIALYLPQFHPIPENDGWHGKGFTEWTNVGRAKPLYKGHYQPRVPADLGYYDLRIPEVREQQAQMAKEAGISAFCYWHYWFGRGRQLLEMPLQEVVKSGKPDFPFCLGWANHSWERKLWNVDTNILDKTMLIEQEYPGIEDIDEHFYKMLPTFKDDRYYKIHGKLLFVIWGVDVIPNFNMFINRWQELAKKHELPGFFFVAYTYRREDIEREPYKSCDAIVLSLLNSPLTSLDKPDYLNGLKNYIKTHINVEIKSYIKDYISKYIIKKPIHIYQYSTLVDKLSCEELKKDNIYPTIIPNWDNTPRNGYGGNVYHNSTPELFKQHVRNILSLISHKKDEDKIVFLSSWNEWGEGNYMEPDLKFGKGYIYALRDVINEFNQY
jgi:hypothetical protein